MTVTVALEDTFARDLPGAWQAWTPTTAPAPRAVRLNHALAAELGLPDGWLDDPSTLPVLAGAAVPDGANPVAQAYSGHQFGGFSPLLGDGRAVLLGEVVDRTGRRRDLALKGSGRTVFSRGGDGRAALGPVLREYLFGEAMNALGVPTTRALAAVLTGETVRRERPLPGAVLTRVAASHLRVGSFEFAARRDVELLRRLADHAVARHDPDLLEVQGPDRYLGLLERVVDRQASLVATWMGLGFVHGVMNTDNVTVSGETIDYGPCAWLEAYDPRAAFSSIDTAGRYAFGNQPAIAHWNLARFAESLGALVGDPQGAGDDVVARLVERLDRFDARYTAHRTAVLRAKLGLSADGGDGNDGDLALGEAFLGLLQAGAVDHTLGWRRLADLAVTGDDAALRTLFGPASADLDGWLARWTARRGDAPVDASALYRADPVYVPRNHLVEQALAAAVEPLTVGDEPDLGPFDALLTVLADPSTERAGQEDYARPAPPEVTAGYRTFCGT